ncbi:MAG: BREX-1 system phosphatase PglZ type B [Acidimicrobiia bacterium]|nr:BREX-1 system phosphatase PglZ type B [Acidimicrobiia bacterium]
MRDRLAGRLGEALEYNANAFAPPVALLWPDEGRHWQQVIPRIAKERPVLTLGPFDPDANRGPAYWIRCVVAGTVETHLPDGIPVVYLPGVGRNSLRAVESCPSDLAPIAELQYRSQWFSHPNGRDWTAWALLSHAEYGLGLRITDSADAVSALQLALDRLMDERIDRLERLVLDADFFHDLVNPDPVRSLLGWLDDPIDFRSRFDEAQWSAFLQQCKADFGFDPTLDGEISAARKLGDREEKWGEVWKRFAETPERYPGIPEQLRKARPQEQLTLGEQGHSESWPQDNEAAEKDLRQRLKGFDSLTPEAARTEIVKLEASHAWRRSTIWADLDHAPLAFALEQLAALADLAMQPLATDGLTELIRDYVDRGWRADDAALRALKAVESGPDREAVAVTMDALYRPWIDEGAKTLQSIIGPMANSGTYETGAPASPAPGTVTVFIDGLRLDIAHRVRERLAAVGLDVDAGISLAALPTVTQTAKPVLAPIPRGALTAGPDLHPANSVTGTRASVQVLRSLMKDNGVQVLDSTDVGDPTGTAWAEAGEIDHRGHDVGSRLVDYLDQEVDRIVGRVRELLEAGWQRVEVVTDHGWILLPGGLEKVDLPPATTEVKKGRCARLKAGSVVETPTVPWFWDQDVRIAIAPGVTCFEAGKEYEHGGVSPQECIVPRLTVTVGVSPMATDGPEITSVKWLGLLCRIELTGAGSGVIADLRALPADPKTSIAEEAKETFREGKVSLIVPDEEHEGEPAHLVLVGPDGQILVQRQLIVGRNR